MRALSIQETCSRCKLMQKLRKKKLGVMEMNDNACTNLEHKVYRVFITVRFLSLWFVPMETLVYILLRFSLPPSLKNEPRCEKTAFCICENKELCS